MTRWTFNWLFRKIEEFRVPSTDDGETYFEFLALPREMVAFAPRGADRPPFERCKPSGFSADPRRGEREGAGVPTRPGRLTSPCLGAEGC